MKQPNYKWAFQNIGGTTRVRLQSGEDLKHLGELDQKMWTVLSCPTKGLEIDEKSLNYIDNNGDGKIRVAEVVKTAEWLTSVISNADLLLEGSSSLKLSDTNQETEAGKSLYNSAKQILANLGKESDEITIADTSDSIAIFAKTRFNGDGIITEASAENDEQKALIAAAVKATGGVQDRSGAQGVNAEQIEAFYKALTDYAAWQAAAVELPYGEKTDAAIDAYNALDSKVKDFFMRSKLAAFDQASTAALDVQVSRIEAISAENLTGKTEEIASYPIARINGKAEIDLSAPINPAWAGQFAALKAIAIDPKQTTLTESDWTAIGEKFASYSAWKAAKAGANVEELGLDTIKKYLKDDKKSELLALVEQDKALEAEANGIDNVDCLLHLYRDFHKLLRNYITLEDFYNRDKDVKAIFQAGTLYIDQRACHLCLKVTDAGAQATMAPASGMYLIFCDCTRKDRTDKLSIVAAMTVGDTGDLMVGKNAIFYDRNGLDWDAVITKIIDNPISIKQAFWSPYRRLAKWIEDMINKRAAEKDSKMMAETTTKLQTAPTTADGKPAQAQPFDIGKFAGIFAALGMALGMIASALVSILKGFVSLSWWQGILVILAIILLISGPSMIMAWLKLRKRNLAPILNANGWAVNAAAIVNIPFGATLTDQVKFPIVKMKDPYAKKGMATWKKWCLSIAALLVVLCGLWLGNLLSWANCPSPLSCFDKAETTEVAAEPEAETAAEPIVVEGEE